jgi:hypothetical protein
MKWYITLIFLFFGLGVFSQNFSNYQNITLQTAADYRKVEPQVMLAYELVLSTPVDKKNTNRLDAISFIMRWMSGTSDYSFVMDEALFKITNNDKDILGVYFACLAKYALQHGKNVDRSDLRYNSYLMLAQYCEIPENNLKPRGEIKKMVEAKNQNQLKEYLEKKSK